MRDIIIFAMPELPEVEIVKEELRKKVEGKIIADLRYDTAKLLKPSPPSFINGVKGKRIKEVGRRAKLIIFKLAPGGFFICHLKLSGRLLFRESPDIEDKYVRVVFLFKDGTELRFASSRKFGYLHYLNDRDELAKILGRYGPEPLGDLSLSSFYQILQSSGKKIKALLMDQTVIAGIGNIYANDSLWMAKIHPERRANSLSRAEGRNLFNALEQVLKEAFRYEGASDQWYRHTDGSLGHYQEHFKVYGKKGERCLRCGSKIQYKKINGRGTFWCPKCQRA